VINCLHPKGESTESSLEPCNHCDNCRTITQGSHVDVLEIDAASNRGIDEIRELRERIAFAPAFGKWKVYIIDEAHMLTREAFNALLKTLEEPPKHVMFILATTEPHKLPDTITSRCVAIQFTKATTEEIAASVERIATGEKLKIDRKTIASIVKRADGSFRDAAKILESMVAEHSGTSGELTLAVEAESAYDPSEFVNALVRSDTQNLLQLIETKEASGVDFLSFTKTILDLLHENLLSRYDQREISYDQLGKLTQADIVRLIKLFTRAYSETKSSPIPELPLELVVIEWGEGRNFKFKITNSNDAS